MSCGLDDVLDELSLRSYAYYTLSVFRASVMQVRVVKAATGKVKIALGDNPKTAFKTRYGTYKFL